MSTKTKIVFHIIQFLLKIHPYTVILRKRVVDISPLLCFSFFLHNKKKQKRNSEMYPFGLFNRINTSHTKILIASKVTMKNCGIFPLEKILSVSTSNFVRGYILKGKDEKTFEFSSIQLFAQTKPWIRQGTENKRADGHIVIEKASISFQIILCILFQFFFYILDTIRTL